MLHAGVEMSGEGVFYEQRGEVESPQHQLLASPRLLSGLITREHPGSRLPSCRSLQQLITEVENVYPMIKLAFTCNNKVILIYKARLCVCVCVCVCPPPISNVLLLLNFAQFCSLFYVISLIFLLCKKKVKHNPT